MDGRTDVIVTKRQEERERMREQFLKAKPGRKIRRRLEALARQKDKADGRARSK